MHTKTHMWGTCCERGVRVLRACEWLLVGVCVSATAKRVEFAGKKDGNERLRRAAFRRWTPMLQTCACGVALLTRPVGRGGAHGAFVSGRVVARPTFFCMLLLLPSAAWSLVSQAAMASSRKAPRATHLKVQLGPSGGGTSFLFSENATQMRVTFRGRP